ncbi:cupin domain-containing protein [Sulfitobacter sabulilitoris]|uniref:Cupin n=1 Tax=Sulfitobacter sabulilitoris TaxID=2562655 RepID=A0A5S3PGI8_9RHOB|nr:cupin domain-containing protein [Sulfitobacter sabulilitoris]TMM50752.1 cupin [Sulfitobacter sabulilitoris]
MRDISDLKTAVAFGGVDADTGWEQVPGGAPGVQQKMLSGALDEAAGRGVRTRLIRFLPGTVAPDVFVHDYWEEVYLIDGDLTAAGQDHGAPSYACRPPGTPHGPFASLGGCLFFEIQYYV